MKNIDKRLKIGIISIIGIFVIIGAWLMVNNSLSDNPVPVMDNSILSDKDLGSILLTNLELTEEEGISTLKGKVTAKEDTNVNYIEVKLLNDEDTEILTLIGYVGGEISKYETRNIKASTDGDLTSIAKIEYEVFKD